MKTVKPILIILSLFVLLILGLFATGLVLSLQYEINPSHDTAYFRDDIVQVEKPAAEPDWRVLLLGDAGESTLKPWSPSLE
ncbi:MAG: hypothetical protein V7754_23375, partial [Halioglobus sp.]